MRVLKVRVRMRIVRRSAAKHERTGRHGSGSAAKVRVRRWHMRMHATKLIWMRVRVRMRMSMLRAMFVLMPMRMRTMWSWSGTHSQRSARGRSRSQSRSRTRILEGFAGWSRGRLPTRVRRGLIMTRLALLRKRQICNLILTVTPELGTATGAEGSDAASVDKFS